MSRTIQTPSGLKYTIDKEGAGEKIGEGKKATVKVYYTGRLENGDEFDSSFRYGNLFSGDRELLYSMDEKGTPYEAVVGDGQLLKCWEEAIPDMRSGEVRTLISPPNLAWGDKRRGNQVPPNTTVIYEIELISFLPHE
jgi:FKBP-type peptidyl-prolyl cis-trans isomerase